MLPDRTLLLGINDAARVETELEVAEGQTPFPAGNMHTCAR